MIKKKIRYLIFLIYLIVFLTCSIFQKKETTPYRLIDHFNKKNIISSPFIGLYQKFDRINQKWSGQELKPFQIEGKKYYAIPSLLPILGWEERGKPEMMKIFLQGKEIPFLKDSSPDAFGWKLKKGEFELDQFIKNREKAEALILNEKQTFIKRILLPASQFILKIWAKSTDPSAHFPRLRIYLNNNPLGEIVIDRSRCYKLTGQAKFGVNVLVFSYEKSTIIKEQPAKGLSIDKISLKAMKDIVLLANVKDKRRLLTSEFSAEYLAEPVNKIFKIEKNIDSSQSHLQEIEFDSSGKKIIEIVGFSPNLISSFTVKLNDNKIYQGKMTSHCQHIHSIEKYIEKGKHKLKIECPSSAQEKRSIHLSNIIIEDLVKGRNLHLAEIEKVARIPDLSIGKNTLGLKKKLVVPNLSWRTSIDNSINTIFAPPLTYLEFTVKIPQSAVLDFGYGLLAKSLVKRNYSAHFKIIIQDDQKSSTAFSESLYPYRRKSHRKLFHKKVNLAPYSNKKVKIKLITTSPSLEEDPLDENSYVGNELAYWYNPVIYVPSKKKKTTKPEINIILISLDTLRADHLKCYGYPRDTSPYMDQLGTEGVIFTNAYSTTSWTLPAHISLLTSLDTRNHKVNKGHPVMDNSIVTIADILRKNGYFTSGFTGGALLSQRFGFSKGFDFYREFRYSRRQRNSAGVLFDNSDVWLNRNKDKKFFLFLHTYQPHAPYNSPPPFNTLFIDVKKAKWEIGNMTKILYEDKDPRDSQRFRNLTPEERENIVALYDAEIRYTDECLIKPLVEKLKKFNLYERTMIIVTSDHGEEFLDHMAWLHGHTLYNELIRIPLIIKFPFSKHKDLKIDKFVRITDIMPTVLQEAGINHSSHEFDGKSLLETIRNNESRDRVYIADIGAKNYPPELPSRIAISQNEFKLVLNNDFGLPPEQYFPCPPPIAQVELYDLKKDPQEKKNISREKIEMVQSLLKKIYELYEVEPGKELLKSKEMDKELEEVLRALGYIR